MAEPKNVEGTRTPRASDTRQEAMREAEYNPGEMLPKPRERDGIEYRYVRVSTRGSVDNINYSQALRTGWSPAKVTDLPELGHILSDQDSAFPEGVLIGGLLLCQRDAEIGKKMRKAANEEVKAQIQALDKNYMRDGGDSRMPKFADNRSSIRFGE
tara:strand:+ start:451 stop:918 length:468 start_codon:yes stop_codon:yes gene_type:complete